MILRDHPIILSVYVLCISQTLRNPVTLHARKSGLTLENLWIRKVEIAGRQLNHALLIPEVGYPDHEGRQCLSLRFPLVKSTDALIIGLRSWEGGCSINSLCHPQEQYYLSAVPTLPPNQNPTDLRCKKPATWQVWNLVEAAEIRIGC